jgi:heterotetrameric sarcosine oxidase gamma subunit
VAERTPRFVSALDGIVMPGRYGRAGSQPGVTVREVPAPGLATVIARKGDNTGLAAAARASFGIELPVTPRRVEGAGIAFVWAGPDQWLAHCIEAPSGGMEALLTGPLGPCAAITDQSHARALLRISGPRVRDALAKGVAIDLHPRAFRTGDTAITSVAHVGVQFWQIDDAPTYEFTVARSFAASSWRWLEASAAEYGLEVVSTDLVG